MTKLPKILYTYYSGILFILSFLLIFPFFLVCIWIPGLKKFGRKINQSWAKALFSFTFLPIQIDFRAKLEKNKPYIYLANHFSYLDVPMMGFVPGDIVFVGKASIRKVPLFGYYFKNLHIAVDRSRIKSRAETMRRVGDALDQGSGIVLFPEGGIYTKNPPFMVPFKNGAFRMAFDKQIEVIPVTLSFNHLILPDEKELLLRRRPAKMVFHEALNPNDFNSDEEMKERCFEIIQNQLLVDNRTTLK